MRLLSSVLVIRSCATMYFLLSPQLCLCLSSWFVFVSLKPFEIKHFHWKKSSQKTCISMYTSSFRVRAYKWNKHIELQSGVPSLCQPDFWPQNVHKKKNTQKKAVFLDVTWCAQIWPDRPRQPSNDHRYTRKTKSQPYARASLRHQGQWEPTSPVSRRV